MMWKEAVLS